MAAAALAAGAVRESVAGRRGLVEGWVGKWGTELCWQCGRRTAEQPVLGCGLRDFLRQVVFHEEGRCRLCYSMRLLATVQKALEIRADAFSTTLLYSKYQKHDLIKNLAGRLAEQYNIPFYYRDFREGWQQGIDMAIEMELYRQPYCGCIYSEQERYDKKLRKN